MVGNKTGDLKVWEQTVVETTEEEDYLKVGSIMAHKSWLGVFCAKSVSGLVSEVKQENLSKNISGG